MPMSCPCCKQDLGFQKYWTAAQKKHQSPYVGGRHCCRTCYELGPTTEDYGEVSGWLSKIEQWSAAHRRHHYPWQNFMVNFLRSMDSVTRKAWSHKGLLRVRVPTDYISDGPRGTVAFDPRNESYAIVIKREVPRLSALMNWGGGASKVLCGDCIEALMAAAEQQPQLRGPQLQGLAEEVDWQKANRFFTDYAYAVWRIVRVARWHNDTVTDCTTEVHKLLERVDDCFYARDCFPTQPTIPLAAGDVHPSVSVASSSGSTPAERDLFRLCHWCRFPSTMVCSSCQVAGCGLCIILSSSSKSLLCGDCRQPQQEQRQLKEVVRGCASALRGQGGARH